MSKRILITGSSGFIGGHLVKLLMNQGYDVCGLDVNSPTSPIKNYHFFKCDIRNADELHQAVSDSKPDMVVHLAARTDLNGNKVSDYSANVEGVQNLTEVIKENFGVQRLICTSSQLVCRVGYVPESDTDYCPNTFYGESKVLTEKITRETSGKDFEWCLVRPTTVWGPGMSPHYQRFLNMVHKGRYFHIGRRPLYKSYSYVGNIVYQYQKLLEAPKEQIEGKTFYLADYECISLRDWVNSFQREFESAPVRTIPENAAKILAFLGDMVNAAGIKSFPFNSFRLRNILTEYQFDLSSTAKVCGPVPYTMEQGVKETALWFQEMFKENPETLSQTKK